MRGKGKQRQKRKQAKYQVIREKLYYRQLRRIHVYYYRQIEKAVDSLVYNPWPQNSKELEGPCEGLNYWRIRIDDYRIVYHIDEDEWAISIKQVGLKKGPEFYEGLC